MVSSNPGVYTLSSLESNTRDRILDAAIALVREGSGGASMVQIAKAAGVSRQGVYLHFADRADLYVAMVRRIDEQRGLAAALKRIDEAPSGKAALTEAIAIQARMNPHLYPVAANIEALRRQDPALQRAWDDRLKSRLKGARAIVRRLHQEDALRPDMDQASAADMVWTLLSLRTWEDLTIVRGWSADKYIRRIEDLLARLVYR